MTPWAFRILLMMIGASSGALVTADVLHHLHPIVPATSCGHLDKIKCAMDPLGFWTDNQMTCASPDHGDVRRTVCVISPKPDEIMQDDEDIAPKDDGLKL